MIIGERNLIIGLKNAILSNNSISTFFYITKQYNYIINKFNIFLFKILPVSNAPPHI